MGGLVGLGVGVPLTGALGLEVHATLSVAGSPLDEETLNQVPGLYDLKAIWTRELTVGLTWGF